MIQTGKCDICGAKHIPVQVNVNQDGSRHAECAVCNHPGFESQAREDIDRWLAGEPGTERLFGRSD